MTASATPRLRPLGLGELLDQTIRLYRRNFLTLIGIVALVQAPLMLLQMLTSLLTFSGMFEAIASPGADPSSIFGYGYFAGLAGSFLIGILGYLLLQGIAAAAVARAAAASYLGRPIGILAAYGQIGQSWWQLIGALLLAGLLGLGLLLWTLVPCVGWLTGPGMLIFFWLVLVPLIAPVIVLEKQTISTAIQRAWDLARQRFWWVLGFMAVLMIFSQLVVAGPVYLVTALFQLLLGNPVLSEDPGAVFTLQTVVQSLVGLVFGLVYLPLQLTGITLLYFDLRVRSEGFDLALLAEGSKTAEQVELTDITANSPRPELANFSINRKELGYFALIGLAGVLLYFVLIAVFGFLFFVLMAATASG
jgi:hypothetical protein